MNFESRLFAGFSAPSRKRRVFVSYHHDNDQGWYDLFVAYYGGTLDSFTNRSLDEPIDSDHLDYVHQSIRENNIQGTSVTIVLCGAETWKRKCVDWEIGSTLNMRHGLVGVALPSIGADFRVPDRFFKNHEIGYAKWLDWSRGFPLSGESLESTISDSVFRAGLITPQNSEKFMTRNRP